MQDLLRRYGAGLTTLICLLVFFWLVILVIVPNITLFESSFRPYLPVTEVGGPKDVYSFDNYMKVFGGEVEVSPLGITFLVPVHVLTFFLTIWYSVVVTVMCFLVAYPMAYYMAKIANPRSVPTLLLLIFVPLWVSEVLRAFAWWIILAFKGPLNSLMLALGLIDAPVRWITDYDAVVIGLVYTYVLFMLFPVYNAVSSLDTNQIEAAEDLGARGGRSTGASSCPMRNRAWPPAPSWSSCSPPVRCWCRRSSVPPRRNGSPRPSTSGSTTRSTGTRPAPMPSCSCSSARSSSRWRCGCSRSSCPTSPSKGDDRCTAFA